MKLSAEDVRQHLNKLLAFLEPVHSVAAAYVGSFFTENLWDLVPRNIQKELSSMTSIDDFICNYTDIIKNVCPRNFADNHPNLVNYIITAVNLSILNQKDFLLNIEDFIQTTQDKKMDSDNPIQLLSPVMTEKKLHEVQTAAKVTVLLANHTGSSHVVDVGAGKGYLSSVLAVNYNCNVLGLEISQEKTCSALKRSKLIAQNIKADVGKGHVKKKLMEKQYKQAVAVVGGDTNITTLLREHFNDVNKITMVGLHTCGDLSPACLKLFLESEEIQGILNIGCCYHYISEEFSDDQTAVEERGKNDTRFGFPLSSHLRKKRCFLGRNIRMLSAHSLDRISYELGKTQTSLWHKAVLETVLEKHGSPRPEGNFTKLPKKVTKCEDFYMYMEQSLKHLNVNFQLTGEDVAELYKQYKDKKPLLTAFFLLRVTLAPVVESIILLDRLLYLIENGTNNAYLVRLFNLETSPRGFGVIAWKD